MRKCSIFLYCLLLSLTMFGQTPPRWVNDAWRASSYPDNVYYAAFLSEDATSSQETPAQAMARMEIAVKRKVSESIRVRVKSQQTLREEDAGTIESARSYNREEIQTSADAEIVGLKAESYYDEKTKQIYAFAYVNKYELKAYYKSGVSLTIQKIETTMRSAEQQENNGEKGRAKKLYEEVQPLFGDLEFAQSLLIAVGSDEESIQTNKSLALRSALTVALARIQSNIAIHITSEEWNFSQQVRLLAPKLKAELAERGYSFAPALQNADWLLTIEAATRQGSVTNGIYITYLDAEISIVEQRTGKEIYNNVFTNLKGGGLDYSAAGRKAYESGLQIITDEIIKSIEK